MKHYVEIIIEKDEYLEDMIEDLHKIIGTEGKGIRMISIEGNRAMIVRKLTDHKLEKILTMCKMSPLGGCYSVLADGKKVW